MPSLRSLLSFVFSMGAAAILAVVFLLTMDMLIHVPLPYAIAGSFLLVSMIMAVMIYLASRQTVSPASFASPAFETAGADTGAPRAGRRPPGLLLLEAGGRQEHRAADSGTSSRSGQQRARRGSLVTVRSILLFDASQQQAREEVA
jgi:hypothetical protein